MKCGIAALAPLIALGFPHSLLAELPLTTQKATTLGAGILDLDFGLGLRQQARDFGVRNRDWQADLGKARLTAGIGERVEIQITGTAVVRAKSLGKAQNNSGDWSVGTKIHLLPEKGRRPSLGVLWEVKLPIASDEKGSGTDETDFFAFVLLSNKISSKSEIHLNLGGGLLGNPDENSAQDDVVILRAAWLRQLTPKSHWGLEVLIRDGFEHNDSPRLARTLFSRSLHHWAIYGGIGIGLNEETDDWQADLGFRRRFQWRRE